MIINLTADLHIRLPDDVVITFNDIFKCELCQRMPILIERKHPNDPNRKQLLLYCPHCLYVSELSEDYLTKFLRKDE